MPVFKTPTGVKVQTSPEVASALGLQPIDAPAEVENKPKRAAKKAAAKPNEE